MHRRLCLAVAIACAASAVSGCAGDSGGHSDFVVDCFSTKMEWNGVAYFRLPAKLGEDGRAAVPTGGRLGTGTAFTCDPRDPDRSVSVRRLRGVPPVLGVGVKEDPASVYLPEGYFFEQPNHPVFGVLKLRERLRPTPRRACSLIRVAGDVLETPFPGGRIVIAEGEGLEVLVAVTPRTRFEGLHRHGQAYVHRGDHIAALGRWCRPWETSSDFQAETIVRE